MRTHSFEPGPRALFCAHCGNFEHRSEHGGDGLPPIEGDTPLLWPPQNPYDPTEGPVMTELHSTPDAAEAALRREWAAKDHNDIYVAPLDITKPFEGQVIELTFNNVDPEPIETMTGLRAAWVDAADVVKAVGEMPGNISVREAYLRLEGKTPDMARSIAEMEAKPRNVAAKVPAGDPWANLFTYSCSTCRFFVPKREADGRCRRHAPTMDGYPVVYPADWCGDHKLGTNPSRG